VICSNDHRRCRFTKPQLWFVLFLAVHMLFPAIAPASETAVVSSQSPSKIHITADRMVSNTRDRYAEFSGNVNAVQGDTTIRADALKIYYKEDADLSSGGGTQEDLIRQIVATGDVQIRFEDKVAYGDQAVYTSGEGLLVLTGKKARIESEGNYINGEEIVLNRSTGQVSVTGGAGDRVEAVFESESDLIDSNGGNKSEKKRIP